MTAENCNMLEGTAAFFKENGTSGGEVISSSKHKITYRAQGGDQSALQTLLGHKVPSKRAPTPLNE
jgi:hypothetical protein